MYARFQRQASYLSMHVTALIVSRNRCNLLRKCIRSITRSWRPADRIVVFDNASDDGTPRRIEEEFRGEVEEGRLVLVESSDNLGGAGGFARGMARAIEMGTDWLWMMDDDAEVTEGALEALLAQAEAHPRDCLSSVAVTPDRKRYSWGLRILRGGRRTVLWEPADAPGRPLLEALYTPFLGMLVPASVVRDVGFPREDFFIWSDDVEYCARIRDSGAKVWYVKDSVVVHPLQSRRQLNLLVTRKTVVDAPLWKQYYGIRNEIYMYSRRRDWWRLVERFGITAASALTQGRPLRTWPVYARAVADGVLGRLGRRMGPGRSGGGEAAG
jgi:GT2 family glycosyltransferase